MIEVEDYDGIKIMKNIERACRTCYRSEGNITDDSYKNLLKNCINRGHESVLEHEKITIRMICDIGVYKDLTRHRFGSFSIESTRYCAYNKDKFDNEIKFIKPIFYTPGTIEIYDNEKAIEKIIISHDSLTLLKAIAAECEKSNVYISAERWRGLAKMARMQAFFAERKETSITDFLFLAEDLWGKRISNEAIRKGFSDGMHAFLNDYSPDPEELKKSTQYLLNQAEHFRNSNGNRYKTVSFDGEEFISYTITVFNEPITLFAPVSRIGTHEDFYPLNAMHKEEPRAKCNYMGGDICKISIDSKAKRNGMRASSLMANNQTVNANTVYEDYAKLPTEILQTNDPEIIAQNQAGLKQAHDELFKTITQTLQCIKNLKALYQKYSEFQNDPFISMNAYKDFMNLILKRYKALGEFSKELQQYEAAILQASSGMA